MHSIQVIKAIWQKDASPPHTDGSVVFAMWRQCVPHLNTCFPGPTRVHNPNSISIGSAIFAQLTAVLLYITTNPLKLSLPMGYLNPPSNTWFLRPTRVFNPNGISIGWAVFAGLSFVTDRQTDKQTDRQTTLLVCNNRPHLHIVRSSAMRRNNIRRDAMIHRDIRE